MKIMKARGLLVLIVFLGITRFVSGQYGSFGLTDARQLAMGNTYASNSRELYAAGKNPSLLAYRVSDRKLDILFPNLSMRQYNVTQVTNFMNDYFSQGIVDIITGFNGEMILNAIENNGQLYLGLQIGFLGAGYTHSEKVGSFSFAMKDFLDGYLQLPEGIVNFVNSDNPDQRAIYFNDFNFQASWSRSYELSYGRAFCTDCIEGISALNVGIGVKYIQGFIYKNVTFSAGAGQSDENGVLTGAYKASRTSAFSDDINIENMFIGEPVVDKLLFLDPVGNGFGLDLGLSLISDRGINFGISLTDAGFINWSGKTKKTLVSGTVRIDSTFSLDDIDSLANLITIEKESDNQFQTHPSTALHTGISFEIDKIANNFPGEMGIAIEIHQGLINDLINPVFPRFALGMDWKPGKNWPVFMTGISNNLNSSFVWSLGLGYELSFVEIYLASPNLVPVLEGKGLNTISVSLCWHFIKHKAKSERMPKG